MIIASFGSNENRFKLLLPDASKPIQQIAFDFNVSMVLFRFVTLITGISSKAPAAARAKFPFSAGALCLEIITASQPKAFADLIIAPIFLRVSYLIQHH